MTSAEPGPRVLVVEDDAELAGLLSGLLGDEGYAVERVSDGRGALHLGLTRAYDVAVLDRGLPALDGTDVVRTGHCNETVHLAVL